MSLGSYHKGCISKSSVASIPPCLILSLSEKFVFKDKSTVLKLWELELTKDLGARK